MKYRVTCLTPTLVGDGQKLAPIDYMVWKDHVNVLNQQRIFKLLSRGPRLESYLAQLKRADRLDFASWGGFAQNFAGRRIPFEDPSLMAVWERAHPEDLFIPTFASSTDGPYLPATSIKGALRTGAVFERWNEATMRDLAAQFGLARPDGAADANEANAAQDGDAGRRDAGPSRSVRIPRRAAISAEEAAVGSAGNSRVRRLMAGDSACVPVTQMKVYLLRTAALVARGKSGEYQLGWKSPRGTADARRIDDSTPAFAEMASPGTAFEGSWSEQSEKDRHRLFAASNHYAAAQLARHAEYARQTGLAPLAASLKHLESRLAEIAQRPDACLLSIGWGGGMLSKIAVPDTADGNYRAIMRNVPLYQRSIRTGLPFPKTRRILFEAGKAAHLPGWVLLEIS